MHNLRKSDLSAPMSLYGEGGLFSLKLCENISLLGQMDVIEGSPLLRIPHVIENGKPLQRMTPTLEDVAQPRLNGNF